MPRRLSRLVWILALAPLAAGGCDDQPLVRADPRIRLGADRIEFGAVAVGDSAERQIAYQNAGQGPLQFTASVEGAPAGVFTPEALDLPLSPGGQGRLKVAFAPAEIGRHEAQLVLLSNDRDNPRLVVELGGDGFRRGELEVEPQLLDFGLVNAGEIAVRETQVRNAGNGELKVTEIALAEGTSRDFSILSSTRTPAELAEGAAVPIRIAYRPGASSTPPPAGVLRVRAADPFRPEVDVALQARLNRAPVAEAGPDQAAEPLEEVAFDGSGSSDADGDLPLSYQWTLARVPVGSQAVLAGSDQAVARLTPDLVGVYEAELWVVDRTGLRSLLPDRALATVRPAERLLVELVWDSPIADLDLHVIASGGTFGGRWDCYFGNRAPDWGEPGDAGDDPTLVRDDLAGFGPETFVYPRPVSGGYSLLVDYFASHTSSGQEPANATLRVFVDGLLKAEIARRLETQGQRWNVAQVRWPEGTVSVIDEVE